MRRIAILSRLTLIVLAVSLVLPGCGSGGRTPRTRTRIINAVLGANAGIPVDVRIRGLLAFANVGFGQASTRTEVESGSAVPVVVEQAGTGVLLINGTTNLTDSVDQSILVT